MNTFASVHKVERGATLIELLAAAAIFSIAILVLFGAFSLALRFTQHSRNISVATNVGQEVIETLRVGGFDGVALNSNPSPVAVPELPQGFTKTYVQYYQGNDKIKQVTVKVYWAQRAEADAITLVTLIGQGGISG